MNSSSKPSMKMLSLIIIVFMSVMISDYKAICNIVGAVSATLITFIIVYSRGFRIKRNSVLLCMVAFVGYYLATSFSNGEPDSIFVALAFYFIEFSCIFALLYFVDGEDTTFQSFITYRRIIISFFVVWDIFCVIAIYNYMQTPDLARLMAAYRASYANLIIGGGYPMAYGSVVLSVFLFQLLVNKKIPKRYRLITVFEILLLAVLVYYTNSFICDITMVLGWVVCYARSTMKGSMLLISAIFIGAIVLVVYLNIGDILEWMIEINNNDFIEERLVEIYNAIVLSNTSYHLDKRSMLYEMSWQSFLNHPILGVGYTYGNVGALHRLNGIGFHSTIFDTLGEFGLLGSIPFLGICLFPVKKALEMQESPIYLVTFFVMLLLNPSFSTFHLVLVVYLIIPLITRLSQMYSMYGKNV